MRREENQRTGMCQLGKDSPHPQPILPKAKVHIKVSASHVICLGHGQVAQQHPAPPPLQQDPYSCGVYWLLLLLQLNT